MLHRSELQSEGAAAAGDRSKRAGNRSRLAGSPRGALGRVFWKSSTEGLAIGVSEWAA